MDVSMDISMDVSIHKTLHYNPNPMQTPSVL